MKMEILHLKYVNGVGVGTDFQMNEANTYGVLFMMGRSQSLNGKSENFIKATFVDVSLEIGYEYR